MAAQYTKKIGNKSNAEPVTKLDTLHDAWSVIKPFAHFSVKAMQLIAHSLIFIVKNIPKPGDHKNESKDKNVIKI